MATRKDKEAAIALKEQKIAACFKKGNQQSKKSKKKKDIDYLLSLLDLPNNDFVRPVEDYKPKSYNLDKQIEDLIKHIYAKYPIPEFLFEAVKKETLVLSQGGRYHVSEYKTLAQPGKTQFAEWLVCIGKGDSFRKLVKNHLTSKEAHLFLKSPGYIKLSDNVWWCRLIAAGCSQRVADLAIERFFSRIDPLGPFAHRFVDLIQFFGSQGENLDNHSFIEVTDFITAMVNNREQEFSFKGRTASSMVALSNEWHKERQKLRYGGPVSWTGLNLPPFQYKSGHVWEITELLTSKDLINEGRAQHHCVGSYASKCLSGKCNIFSMRGYLHATEIKSSDGKIQRYSTTPGCESVRFTIEVNGTKIVQIRGLMNSKLSKPSPESKALAVWADRHSFSFSSYAF